MPGLLKAKTTQVERMIESSHFPTESLQKRRVSKLKVGKRRVKRP